MLTGNLLRVRFHRDRITPAYLDTTDPQWEALAEELLVLFRAHSGRTRGELEDELKEAIGGDAAQWVPRGFAKLLEDRCEFAVIAEPPPEQLRAAAFRHAAAARGSTMTVPHPPFDRQAVLAQAAAELNLAPEALAQGLFADLKSEQRLQSFKDISAARLVARYNVAQAQAVLLKSTRVSITIRGEPPRRFRQLLGRVKFHRLVCDLTRAEPDGYTLTLDGPLSLFSATQKYGSQLAFFLPAILPCGDFELEAQLLWGPAKKPKRFELSAHDGLVADSTDAGMRLPAELVLLEEMFRKKAGDWVLEDATDVMPLGDGFWTPDYRLKHLPSGRSVLLEVLGYWRKASVERHLDLLRQHAREPFLLAISDQFKVDDAELEGLLASVHRFRQMPRYDEIIALAEALIA